MKLIPLVTCLYLMYLTSHIEGSAIQAPLDIISYDDISHDDRKELDYLHQKLGRPKRSGSGSGSGDILESLKVAIGQGIKNKIGEIAKGSAAASARLSSSSSGHSYHHSPPESHDHKSLDFWSLKKSILNTLLQAVKAIKGGVIAIKGQLIKGSGYLTSATGKLIVAKGDAVTNLGKKIASSAVLVPYNHGHPSSSGHAEYGPPPEHHHSAPSGLGEFYHGAPSAPASEFHESEHHHPYHEDETPHRGPSGLLVLKKIHGDRYHHVEPEESKVPPFKSIEPAGPSFGTIIGKFFSASSSLDPHKPEPFGNSGSGSIHPYHSDSHSLYETSETKNHHQVAPSASGYVVDEPDEEVSENEPPDSDSPFEKAPSYLAQHFDHYAGSSSKKHAQTIPAQSIPQKHDNKENDDDSESTKSSSSSSAQHFAQDELVQNLPMSPPSNPVYMKDAYGLYNLPSLGEYPADHSSLSDSFSNEASVALPQQNGQQLYYPSQSSSVIDFTKNYKPPSFGNSVENFISQPSFQDVPDYYKFPSEPIPNIQNPKQHIHIPSSVSSAHRLRPNQYDSVPSGSKYKGKNTRTKHSPSTMHKRQPSHTRTSTRKHKPKQTYDVVKSIAYELGPNGPKRLT